MGRLYGDGKENSTVKKSSGGGRLYGSTPELFQYKPVRAQEQQQSIPQSTQQPTQEDRRTPWWKKVLSSVGSTAKQFPDFIGSLKPDRPQEYKLRDVLFGPLGPVNSVLRSSPGGRSLKQGIKGQVAALPQTLFSLDKEQAELGKNNLVTSQKFLSAKLKAKKEGRKISDDELMRETLSGQISKANELTKKNQDFLKRYGLTADQAENKFGYSLGSGIASIGEAAGLTALTKSTAPSSALFGAIAKGQTYEEARSAGVDPRRASLISGAAGVTEAALEKVGLDLLFKKFKVGKNPVTNFVANSLIKSVTEGMQEGTQEFGSNFWAKVGYDKQRDLMRNVADSAFIGSLLGLAGGGTASEVDIQNEVKQQAMKVGLTEDEALAVAGTITNKIIERQNVDALSKGKAASQLIQKEQAQAIQPAQSIDAAQGISKKATPVEKPVSRETSQVVKGEELKRMGNTIPTEYEKSDFQFTNKGLKELTPSNATDFRVVKYANSIRKGDKLPPIVIDEKGVIIDGNQRYAAYKRAGIQNVPVVEQVSPETPLTTPEKLTQKVDPLIEEAKKYKSAREFVRNSYNDELPLELPSDVSRAVTRLSNRKDVPKHLRPELEKVWNDLVVEKPVEISTLKAGEYGQVTQDLPNVLDNISKKRRSIESPIIVNKDGLILDGHHRVAQAIRNGDKTIQAKVVPWQGEFESKLTEIYNQAQKEKKLTEFDKEAKQIRSELDRKIDTKKKAETEKFQSRVFARLQQEEGGDALKGDLSYQQKNMQEEARKAVELLSTDKQQAFRVAMGIEESPDVLQTAVNIAMSDEALREGNNGLYSRLVKSRSLEQTRRGQELVAEKGSVSDNSTARYVKELLGVRIEETGSKYLDDIVTLVGKKPSRKQKAMKAIEKEAERIDTRTSSKEIDMQEAQSIIDRLACR